MGRHSREVSPLSASALGAKSLSHKARVGLRPSIRALRGDFRKQFHKVEASSPNNGGVKLDSGKYEARVGIDRLVARYQLLIADLSELFKPI